MFAYKCGGGYESEASLCKKIAQFNQCFFVIAVSVNHYGHCGPTLGTQFCQTLHSQRGYMPGIYWYCHYGECVG